MRFLVLVIVAACASPPPPLVVPIIGAQCDGLVTEVPIVDSPHVIEGSAITWTSNPPTSGPHYPIWPKWDRHFEALARGTWLHAAEHGGVVFAYRCDHGCPETVAALSVLVRELPDDPHCIAPVRHRALIVADPLLPEDGTIAAIAWGTHYVASCVDRDVLADFYVSNVGRAGENTCADGSSAYGGTPLD